MSNQSSPMYRIHSDILATMKHPYRKVDETTAYPKLANESDCQPAVEKLYNLCTQSAPPPDFPDSLTKACIEYRKVKTGFSD